MESLKLQNNQLKIDNDDLRTKLRESEIRYNEQRERNKRLNQNYEILRKNYVKLERENQELDEEKNNLLIRFEILNSMQNFMKPIIVKKKWENLLTSKSRLKRKIKYKDIVDKSIRYITECKRARLSLTVGKSAINLNWTEKEMKDHRRKVRREYLLQEQNSDVDSSDNETDGQNNLSSENPIELNNTQNESENETSEDENENLNSSDIEDLEDKNIFDQNCKYTSRHKKKIVTVMDKHRLSHAAYNELKQTSQGELPPINQIKQEKRKMSNRIEIIRHEMVSKR